MKQLIYNIDKEKKLETFLLEKYNSLNYNKICKFYKENKIKVNSKKIPLNTLLKKGDIINLYILDEFLNEDTISFKNAKEELEIIYEDTDIIIVNKPQTLLVNDENNTTSDTLINRTLLYLYKKGEYSENSDFTPSLCHRLDFGTCGLVIIAKNQKILDILLDIIKNHKLLKEYKCITYGYPNKKFGDIETYLIKDNKTGYVKIASKHDKNSKYALTHYEIEKTKNEFALLNIKLYTGRTHQIRVHLSSINCPILGDSKYGNNKINRECKFKYQALCAYKLTFPNIPDFKYISNKVIKLNNIPFENFFN